jgi:site-specific recombinase XerD
MVVIKLFYKYCERMKYCDNIAAGVKSGFKMTGKNKIPLSMDQARTLLKSVDASTVIGKRDRLMIALMLFNGLRTCEVERINIEDVSTREGVPVVYLQRKGKVDKNDMVVLHQKAVEYFEDYISERDFDCKDPLFISHRECDRGKVIRLSRQAVARMVKKRLRKIGINDRKISAHSLRHTFGSLLVEQNVDMEDIRELMGHSSTTVTKIYVELVQQRKMLHCSPSAKMIDQLVAL